jgi:hypothetical protein
LLPDVNTMFLFKTTIVNRTIVPDSIGTLLPSQRDSESATL